MTNYGTIKSYDSDKGSGMISPEKGRGALPFGKADLQQQAQVPEVHQRFGYDTAQSNDGERRAVNLCQQGDGESQQARQARTQQG